MAFNPVDAFKVKMVRGFVKKEDIGPFQQECGQVYPHLPPAGELQAGASGVRGGKPQTRKNFPGFCLERIAFHGFKAFALSLIGEQRGFVVVPGSYSFFQVKEVFFDVIYALSLS